MLLGSIKNANKTFNPFKTKTIVNNSALSFVYYIILGNVNEK